MSVKFLADENFDNNIVRGLLRKQPTLDIITVQEVELRATDDRIILEWAAQTGRVLLTHDLRTMLKYGYDRLAAGLPMAGILGVSASAPISRVIEDILLLAEVEDECAGQIRYVPLTGA